MEKYFVNGEIKEKLNRSAKRIGNERCKAFGNSLNNKPTLERGSKPSGEADESYCEHNINRQCYGNVCIGIKRFVSVNEE